MEKVYNCALIMPKSYESIDVDEMNYVDGGTQVKVSWAMLSRNYCLGIAWRYANGFNNYFAVAKEIHAHAVMYYGSLAPYYVAKAVGVDIGVVNYIKNHSNPIDIGGDDWKRKAVFEYIWRRI